VASSLASKGLRFSIAGIVIVLVCALALLFLSSGFFIAGLVLGGTMVWGGFIWTLAQWYASPPPEA
jgi:hypothetical protein